MVYFFVVAHSSIPQIAINVWSRIRNFQGVDLDCPWIGVKGLLGSNIRTYQNWETLESMALYSLQSSLSPRARKHGQVSKPWLRHCFQHIKDQADLTSSRFWRLFLGNKHNVTLSSIGITSLCCILRRATSSKTVYVCNVLWTTEKYQSGEYNTEVTLIVTTIAVNSFSHYIRYN